MSINTSYSAFVKSMKIALPVSGLLILVAVIAWPFMSEKKLTSMTNVDAESPEVVDNHMIRPKYASVDKQGRPYEVEADWGKPTTDHEADLTTPHGTLTTDDHGDVVLDAKHGHYDKDTRVLNLKEDVVLNTDDGYHFETQAADVNMESKTVEGNVPIQGSGPAGQLQAEDGFKLEETDDGNRIITLKGRSRVVINSETLKKANKK